MLLAAVAGACSDGVVTRNSESAFDVYVLQELDDGVELIGSTPSEKTLEIPPCLYWLFKPAPPVDMEKVRKEIEAKGIPGLELETAVDDDLKYPEGLTRLQTLDVS